MFKDEIDWNEKLWIIPKDKTKNGLVHRVPLIPVMLDLIRLLSSLSNTGWVFSSPQTNGPLSSYGLAQGIKRALRDSGLPRTTPHDLRRTAATIISELGFNRLVVDKILNHKDQTVGGVYDRHSYDKEKREALEAWESELERVLTGKEKVIDIKEGMR